MDKTATDKTAQDITMTCRPEFFPKKLRVHYTVHNRGKDDVYLLDLYPAVDQTEHKAFADYNSVYVCWRADATGYLLKGIPPLPANKKVAVRIIPLGTKLAPDAKVERTFDLMFPLKEQSPWYYSSLEPEDYEEIDIKSLRFTLQFLPSTAEGCEAEPASYEPRLYIVRGKHTVRQVEELDSEFDAQGIKLLKRKDMFSRL